MNKKEAIISLINKKKVGYTPHHFDLTMKITDGLAEYYGLDSQEVEDHIGNHFLYVDFTASKGKSSGYRANKQDVGIVTDEFGVVWDKKGLYDVGDWAMVDFPVKEMSLKGYDFPNGKGEGRFDGAKKLMDKYTDRFNVLRMTGLLDSCWHITGLENFLMAMALDEAFTNQILDKVTNYMINIIKQVPKNVDAVRFIEDWGVQKGLLFSRRDWQKYIKPRLKSIHEACRKKGLYVMHHSCGDITELFPDIIELGIDIIDAIQPESMDISFLKKEYGKDIVFFGGLGAQSTLPLGTPKQVIDESKKTLKILGENGGYIIGPAGSISTETPMDNIIALINFCIKLKEEGI
jgi:uroporphyrinogen decarboxylase